MEPDKEGNEGRSRDYEAALCCLVFLRALRLTTDFYLFSKHDDVAGKFDDIVLMYKTEERDLAHRAIFVQVKNRERRCKTKRLTASDPFRLSDCLRSFAEIRGRWEEPVTTVEGRAVRLAEVSLVLHTDVRCDFDGVARDVTADADVRQVRDLLGAGGGRLLRVSEPRTLQMSWTPATSDFFRYVTLFTEQMGDATSDQLLVRELTHLLGLTSPSVVRELKTKLLESFRSWYKRSFCCLTAESKLWTDVLEAQVARINAENTQWTVSFTREALEGVRSVVDDHKHSLITVADEHHATATRARLQQALGSSCLVLDARFLLDGRWSEIAALWGTRTCPSLAVDLSAASPEDFSQLLRRLQEDTRSRAGRGLVVIAREWFVLRAEPTWSVVDPVTREGLLSVRVNLQGRVLALRDVVGERVSDVMTDKVIAALCHYLPAAGTLQLGVAELDSSSLENYVPRCLQRSISRFQIHDRFGPKRLIFLDTLLSSLNNSNHIYKILSLPELNNVNRIDRTTFAIGVRTHSEIRKHCHRLRVAGVSEDGLEFIPFTWLLPNAVIVVEGVAGAGKSTFVTAMCKSIKETYPDHWVLRFDLAKHAEFLSQGRDFDDAGDVTTFLLSGIPREQRQQAAQRRLLEHSLYVTGKVFLFLDALDEIFPEHATQCCHLLKGVASKVQFKQMVVTTRPTTTMLVESALDEKAFSLSVFGVEDQNLYLERFCVSKKKVIDQGKISSLRKAAGRDLENPLLCRIAAEVLLHAEDQNLLKFWNPWRKVVLYKRFVQQTIVNRVAEKFSDPNSVAGETVETDSLCNEHLKNLQALAARKLMPTDKITNVDIPTNPPDQELGLVVSDGQCVDFEHRSFAEFFLGCWLAQHWEECHQELLCDLLIQEDFEFVAATMSWSLFENFPEHVEVARESFLELPECPGTMDRGGRSVLHVAAMGQHTRWVMIADEILRRKDKVLRETPARFAELSGNLAFLDLLVRKGKTLEGVKFLRDQGAATKVLIQIVEQDLTGLFQFIVRLHPGISPLLTEEGDTLLHKAAGRNATEVIKMLLTQSHFVNAANREGMTPLHVSAKCQDVEVMSLLLENGADPNSRDRSGVTALMLSAGRGHLDAVKLLLQKRADPDVQDSFGDTALTAAVGRGRLKAAKLLLLRGADPDMCNERGDTGLIVAAGHGHRKIVEMLLRRGADPELRNRRGCTGLMLAASLGHAEVVKVLLRERVHLFVQDISGNTALMLAAERGHEHVVRLLLNAVDDTAMKNNNGNTALMLASGAGHKGVVNMLINEFVADPCVRNKRGDTALTLAAAGGHSDVVKVLLNDAVALNKKNNNGDTALTLAAGAGHLAVVNMLLEVGVDSSDSNTLSEIDCLKAPIRGTADPNAQNKRGDTALILASAGGHLDVAKALLLLRPGEVDPNAKNKVGDTALMVAARRGYLDVVRLLLVTGADPRLRNKRGETASEMADREIAKVLQEASGRKSHDERHL